MKVRIGSGPVQKNPDLTAVQNQIIATIVDQAVQSSIDMTPRFLRRLRERVQTVATNEANQIFKVITSIIDRPAKSGTGGFSASSLMSGIEIDPIFKPRALAAGGAITWPELSYRYAMQKSKTGNRYRFFRNKNTMRNYFKGRSANIIQGRFGGVQVSIDQSEVKRRRNATASILPEDVSRIVLGSISVNIFPRLTPALAPMLSTRQWTSTNGGKLEASIFSGTRTAAKLLNRRNSHRPLVTPVVQFFILVRIPNAIRRNLQDYLRRTGNRAD